MESDDRQALVDDLLAALDRRGSVDGSHLLELMRTEQNLLEALAVIRRQITRIVRGAEPPTA